MLAANPFRTPARSDQTGLRSSCHTAGDEPGLNGKGREQVGLHDLRHSFVAVGFDKGLSAPQIAALARHANAKVTLGFYAGLTDKGREFAATKLTEGGFGV